MIKLNVFTDFAFLRISLVDGPLQYLPFLQLDNVLLVTILSLKEVLFFHVIEKTVLSGH